MNTSSLAKGGILTALTCILIYISTIFPFNKIFILGITSALVALGIIIDKNIKLGYFIFLSSSILSFFLLGFRGIVFLYIIFFGPYSLIKLHIERFRKLPLEIFLKLCFFNLILLISYWISKFILIDINLDNILFPLPILFIALQFVFFIYDYTLTLFVHTIYNKIL